MSIVTSPTSFAPDADAERRALLALKIVVVASALGAISIGPVPLQWLVPPLSVIVAAASLQHISRIRVPGATLFAAYLLWAWLITVVNFLVGPAVVMPIASTTRYSVFIALRFLNLAAFAAVIWWVAWMIVAGFREQLMRWISRLGCVVALVSLYVYVAQLTGLPDIPRTRLGTGGGQVGEIAFTYAFHRAMGTFREPSHLAEWLIVPFFLSFAASKGSVNFASVTMACILLLTGSLTGILGAAGGAVAATLVTLLRGRLVVRWSGKGALSILVLVFGALMLFKLVVHGNDDTVVDLWKVITDRTLPIVDDGLEVSNRGDVYRYVAEKSIPALGHGIGSPNIQFAHHLSVDVVASLLSLYITNLLAVGPLGLALLVGFLAVPLVVNAGTLNSRQAWCLLAAYIAWLIMYSVHSEELSLMFAVAYALLVVDDGRADRIPAGAE